MDYSLLLGIHDADQGGNASGVDEESEETDGDNDSDVSLPDSPDAVVTTAKNFNVRRSEISPSSKFFLHFFWLSSHFFLIW